MAIRSQTKLAEILYSSCPRGQSSERDHGTCLICRGGTAEESDIIRLRDRVESANSRKAGRKWLDSDELGVTVKKLRSKARRVYS